jgi:hypothetical protein
MSPAMIPAVGMLPMDTVGAAPLIAIDLGSLAPFIWAAIAFGIAALIVRRHRPRATPVIVAPRREAAQRRAA